MTVLPEAVPPSPNTQADVVGLLVLVSVNVQVVDVVMPDDGDTVNAGTGFAADGFTDIVVVAVLVAPLLAVTVNVTV